MKVFGLFDGGTPIGVFASCFRACGKVSQIPVASDAVAMCWLRISWLNTCAKKARLKNQLVQYVRDILLPREAKSLLVLAPPPKVTNTTLQ